MHKRRIVVLILALTAVFSLFAACDKKENPPASSSSSSGQTAPDAENCKLIEIIVNSSDVTLVESVAVGYDYTPFFTVYGDGKKCATKAEYIDVSAVKAEVGTYKVYCKVKNEIAEITVHVNSSAPVSVTALVSSVDLKDDELDTYDFASLFRVSLDGQTVNLTNADVNLSGLKKQRGTYVVSCTYKGKRAAVNVNVSEAVYVAELAAPSVKIHVSQVETYNFGEYFLVMRDGAAYSVTNSMLSGEVKSQAGEYTLGFERRGVTLSLKVIVSAADVYTVAPAYSDLRIPLADALVRDYSKDFYLYKNGVAEEVKADMINAAAVSSAKIGDVCEVILTAGEERAKLKLTVTDDDVIIAALNAEAFVNGAAIDLTSLFEVSEGGNEVAVDYTMISGEPDYSREGDYRITLNYRGRTATAVVTVKNGVIIDYARSDEIIVRKGISKETYNFSADFKVNINGVLFSDLSSYLEGVEGVDFDSVGEYPVTLKIKYNDKQLGLSGAKFTYYEKTVTYKVVQNEYTLTVNEKAVEVKKGAPFNELSNITLVLNGITQNITTNAQSANGYTSTYAEIETPLDVTAEGKAVVRVAVYVNGINAQPEYIEYYAIVTSDVKITAQNKVIFTGETIYLPDLFTVTDGGMPRMITLDMISGSFDPFSGGEYELTLKYKELEKTATVTVIEKQIIGTYKSAQLTIGSSAVYDEEGLVVEEGSKSQKIGDLVITSDLNVTVNGKTASNVISAGAGGLGLALERRDFILSYENGIAVIVYDNYLRMQLTNTTMSLVYFNEADWEIVDSFTVNSLLSGKHVLESDSTSYSIDLFKVKNKKTGEIEWYGLKTHLYSHMSSDYDYKTTFGKATLSEGFEKKVGAYGELLLDGEEYKFVMTSLGKASIDTTDSERSYEGSFNGVMDGKNATLTIGAKSGVTLIVGTEETVRLGYYELLSLGYKASDFAQRTYTIHGAKVITTNKTKNTQSVSYSSDLRAALKLVKDTEEEKVEIYPFSYRFAIDTETRKFELLEKDETFGLYRNEQKTKYIMLSGYGFGIANYDMASYEKVSFNYEKRSGAIVINYTGDSLAYGKTATFALNADGNSLSILASDGGVKVNEFFESVALSGGAIVKINSFVIKKGTSIDEFLKGITIITEDGEYTDEQKKNAVYVNSISTSQVGFYQFYVTVKIGGESKNLYYGVQIIDKKYDGKTIVREFDKSFSGESTLAIDEYGYITFTLRGEVYRGNAVVSESGTAFAASVQSENGEGYSLNGSVSNGLLYVEGNGATKFSEHYALRSTEFAGNGSLVLRSVKTDSGYDYYASSSRLVLGEKVSVSFNSGETLEKGAQIKITYASGKTVSVKINEPGNETEGLEIID